MNYNYKNIKIKSSIFVVLVFLFFNITCTEIKTGISTEVSTKVNAENSVKKGFCNLAAFYGTILTHTVIHEVGHAVPGYIRYKDPIRIFIGIINEEKLGTKEFKELIKSNKSFIKFNFFNPHIGCCVVNLRSNYFNIITFTSGPVFGIVSNYIILKGLNVLKYYEKHDDFKRALLLGFKESVFNGDINDIDYKLGIKSGAVISIFQDLSNICNVKDKDTDGYKVLKKLNCSANTIKVLKKVPFVACFKFSRNFVIAKITIESLITSK